MRLGLSSAAVLLLAGTVQAQGMVKIAQLEIGPMQLRDSSLRRLAWEVDKRTSVQIATEPARVRLGDSALFEYPLLYLSSDRSFAIPGKTDLARLRRHLAYGGTLIIDNAEARPGGGFDLSVRELIEKLFPSSPLRSVDRDHVVMKSFYLLDHAVGRVVVSPLLEGVERDERLVILYSQNDLGGAWARDSLGKWENEVRPGGGRQRELAFRVGINLVLYTLCLDYKDDQVHVPAILKRRRWRIQQ